MSCFSFFFFNDTATTEIYTLSLHDALPISKQAALADIRGVAVDSAAAMVAKLIGAPLPSDQVQAAVDGALGGDRKSTRLNSSHLVISYAVFCLKKKKRKRISIKLYEARRAK